MSRPAMLAGKVVVGALRLGLRVVPRPVRKRIEDGVFYGIFHSTRVMNDAYGWRPDQPASPPPDEP